MIFVQTFRKILGDFTERKTQTFQNDVEYVPEMSFLALLSSIRLVALVVTKKAVLRTSSDLSTWNNSCFLFKCTVTFWLRYFSNATFGTLALYILRLRCLPIPYIYKNSFWFFSETWYSSFCIVCNCFDDFRSNIPKTIGRFHRKENTNFPKRRWVRSKNVRLSSSLLSSLAVTTKIVLRTSWDLSTWNNTCFVFKCRVTFRLRQFSKVTFGTLPLYILRLRCLAIPNTYKNSFWFFRKRGLRRFVLYAIVLMIFVQTFRKMLGEFTERKTQTFQNDLEYVPEMSFLALLSSARLVALVVTKKAVLRTSSDLSTWNMSCFLFKYRVTFWLRQFSKVTSGTLALYILRFRCLGISNTYKNSLCFVSKRETFQNDVHYVPEMSFWALLGVILWL